MTIPLTIASPQQAAQHDISYRAYDPTLCRPSALSMRPSWICKIIGITETNNQSTIRCLMLLVSTWWTTEAWVDLWTISPVFLMIVLGLQIDSVSHMIGHVNHQSSRRTDCLLLHLRKVLMTSICHYSTMVHIIYMLKKHGVMHLEVNVNIFFAIHVNRRWLSGRACTSRHVKRFWVRIPLQFSCWALMPQVYSNLPGNLVLHMAALSLRHGNFSCAGIWQPCP